MPASARRSAAVTLFALLVVALVARTVFLIWEPPFTGTIDLDAVLRLADEFEGHADNVAACLHGGLTLAWTGDAGPVAERLDVDPRIQPLLMVPDATLSTSAARGLLPGTVPHADAAARQLRELRRERARAAAGVTPAMVQDLDPATRAYVEELERRNDSR